MTDATASHSDAESRLTRTVRAIFTFALRKPLGAAGLVIIAIFGVLAIGAPWLAPLDPFQINPGALLAPPSPQYWLGTDEFGRDIMSRIIWGARVSMFVGLMAVAIGSTLGAVLGLVGGYLGGVVDDIIQRIVEVLLAFPMLVLALAMVAALGSSTWNVIMALAVVLAPNAARVVRSSVLTIRERPFVEAARNMGLSDRRILFRHILPNCVAPFIITATAGIGTTILSEASLSFLGLGTPPPTPSWGAMLSNNMHSYMVEAPWMALAPGIALTLVVFGFNFLGDALRDVLDPKLRAG